MSQSPMTERAQREISRMVRQDQISELGAVTQYFAEQLDSVYSKLEAQQQYNRQLEEHLRVTTEAIESLSNRIIDLSYRVSRLENYNP